MLTYNSFVNNVYYISLAGIYIDHINITTGDVTVLTLQHKTKEDDGSVANTHIYPNLFDTYQVVL
jgi:hypothetical protein